MYAVKTTNLINGISHYAPARDYADACEKARREREELSAAWAEGEDFAVEVVDDLADDFDFEDQPDWN